VHNDYQGLLNWGGRETADIVYEDSAKHLTSILLNKGYLTGDSWLSRTPTYYIEVKATLRELNTTFFCSQNQFDRMERMQLSRNSSADDVYMFVRVFKLGNGQAGLKIFLDPATLRRNGELNITADRYSIYAS